MCLALVAKTVWISCRRAAAALAALSWPSLLRAQSETDAAIPASVWFELLVPLVVVIAAGVLAFWLVRRRGSLVRGDGPVRLVQVLPIGTRERLLLVRIDDRYCLLGATPVQISPLSEWRASPHHRPEREQDEPTVT